MSEVVSFLESRVSPQIATIAGLIAVAYIAILGLVKLLETWRSLRARKALLEEEKLFHEIAKLRYEIEVIRKEHDLPDLIDKGTSIVSTGEPSAEYHPVSWRQRLNLSLPEIPSLSFGPILTVLDFRFKRPKRGAATVGWALKWLVALVVGSIFVLGVAESAFSRDWWGITLPIVLLTDIVVGIILLVIISRHTFISISTLSKRWAKRRDDL